MHEDYEVWNRVRERLTSANIILVRETLRLIDLPQCDAATAIAALIASEDAGRLRALFTRLANISQNLLVRSGNPSPRQQTATLLANLLGDRIKALGQATRTLTPSALAKQAAYVELSGRLIPLGDWTASSQAAAEQIITDLEKLRAVDPPGFLDVELGEAIAIAWVGLADHLQEAATFPTAIDAYGRAIAAYEVAGQVAEAREVRLKSVALIRRLLVDFDGTITQLNAMLTAIEGQEPCLERAQMLLELAKTYALVGDKDATRRLLEAAERDSWRCGWPAPDVNNINGSFAGWVAHAEALCQPSNEFAEVLFTELAVEATALALRARVAPDAWERDAYFRAVQQLAAIENRLTDTAVAVRNAELDAFFAEFGDPQAQASASPLPMLPISSVFGPLSAKHAALEASLYQVRAEFRRLQEAADKLLPEIEDIVTEAHAHRLRSIHVTALLLRSDIHMAARRFNAVADAARAAFDLPRDPEDDLTIGLQALDSLISACVALDDPAAISAACGDAIALVERYRYNISAPYTQSAFLQERAHYYTMGMDTAWRCEDFEALVQRADMFKAAGSLRNIGIPPNLSAGELDAQFRSLTDRIEQARQAGDAAAVEALAERRRTVWELFAIARARARRAVAPPSLTLAALHAALDPDEAVVSWYWLTRDVLMIIALDNRRVRVAKQKIDAAERKALDDFADKLQSLQHSAGWIDRVCRFSAALLPQNIHPVIEGKRRLILSPHRVLHALPLHILTWEGDPLIRRFAVSYVPNLGCLTRQYPAARDRSVLAVGISDFAIPGEKLKPLPDCVSEAEAVAAVWNAGSASATTLPNEQATTSAIRVLAAGGQLTQFSCLHLATHGADVRGDNPMEAHLWLHDGRLDGLEVATWQLRADLVVLSACHSGQRAIARRGTELMGDDIFGLQAALFTAGAERLLGALWPADSPTAALLMVNFHRRYVAGAPPELALQEAMLDHVDNATPLTRQPYYWAPFYIAAVARPARKSP